ncbi:MAG TPA: benzoate-CoA ligase family protein [Vicinamibacterales bacterium]
MPSFLFNIAEWLVTRHVREGRGDRVAVRADSETLTYARLDDLSNRAGNAFLELGVQRGGRVLLVLHDTPAFYASFLGAIKAGAVPVPVNTLLRGADYAHMLNDSGAQVAVVSEALLGEVLPIVQLAPALRTIVVAGGTRGDLPVLEELMAEASPRLEIARTRRDDPAFWLYSSGSTGLPKGVVHRQHHIVHTVDGYARGVLGLTERDRCLSAAKLFFAYGLGNCLSFPLGVGGEAVVTARRLGPDAAFEAIARTRPTVFFGVPTLFSAMLLVEDAKERYDLTSLRFCVSAGEALPAEIFLRWRDRFGIEILDGIGSTEMLHIFLSNRPGDCGPGTSGREVPGYEARIVDEAGRDIPDGTIGSLLVRGASAASGYWNQPERTRETFRDGWVVTGDKYRRDADGRYVYCGRSDDMLKVGGIWVSPVEVENALLAHPAVLECAVVGAADADGLLKPKAFIVPRPGHEPGHALGREIQMFVRKRIAPYKYPRWIEFVSELPKTATGKIQRFRLRAERVS